MRWTKKKKNNEKCAYLAIQHALLPFICRKIFKQIRISIVWLGAMRVQSQRFFLQRSVLQCFCPWNSMHKWTIQNKAEQKMFIIDIMKMVKSFVALFLRCVVVQYRFFVLLFCATTILLHLFWGVNDLPLPYFLAPLFIILFESFCFFSAPTVIFSFFYKCSGCEMRISCVQM